MSSIQGISSELMDLIDLEDVEAAILFRIDGDVVESYFSDKYSQGLLRTIQWCKANVEKVSLEMKTNNLNKVTYELNDFCAMFFVVNKVTILTAVATKNINHSLLSIESKRKSQIILTFL